MSLGASDEESGDITGRRSSSLRNQLTEEVIKVTFGNKECFSDIENKADMAYASVIHLQEAIIQQPDDWNLLQMESEARQQSSLLQKAKTDFLRQKAKTHWLTDGDSNTAYFHGMLKLRRHKNNISQIKDHEGNFHINETDIQHAFLRYYQFLLGSNSATINVKERIVRKGPVCNENHSLILLSPVTHIEIKEIINSIPNDKAPGPDGYSSSFFKDSWDVVGDDFSHAFQTGKLLKQINATLITLIPKKERPDSVLDYRPIACCNVIYKCISKIICNRLAKVLPQIISPTQGGFIKGRSILENIMVCQDIIRLYERKAISPRCLIKMDLQKAYDTVEWGFLDQMMDALNFPREFRGWVMQCVSTTENDRFHFHPLCKSVKLSHLMFADDLLLFCKGDVDSMMTLLKTFSYFSNSTGLKMSQGKSNAYFNGVNEALKNDILKVSGLIESKLPFKYLGVPIKSTRLSAKDCKPLIDKLTRRISVIGARKLSYAGRLTLIQSVFKTLHNYWAQIFVLPTGVISNIESICRNFLWDGGIDYKRAPLVAWDKICKPKQEGGLGLKNDHVWNKAAIGKLVWWVTSNKENLWVKWVNNLYIKTQHWMNYTPPNSSSWYWRKICQVKQLIMQNNQQLQWTTSNSYSIAKGYEQLREKGHVVPWHKQVWNQYTIPKHAFINWIYFHGNMNTRDKLHELRICEDNTCSMCGIAPETKDHIFFDCQYSKRVIYLINDWTGSQFPLRDLTNWRKGLTLGKSRNGVLNGIVNACIYHIWHQRNCCVHELRLIAPRLVAKQIRDEMKKVMMEKEMKRRNNQMDPWIERLING